MMPNARNPKGSRYDPGRSKYESGLDRCSVPEDRESVEVDRRGGEREPCLAAHPVLVGQQLFESVELTAREGKACARRRERGAKTFALDLACARVELASAFRPAQQLVGERAQQQRAGVADARRVSVVLDDS